MAGPNVLSTALFQIWASSSPDFFSKTGSLNWKKFIKKFLGQRGTILSRAVYQNYILNVNDTTPSYIYDLLSNIKVQFSFRLTT